MKTKFLALILSVGPLSASVADSYDRSAAARPSAHSHAKMKEYGFFDDASFEKKSLPEMKRVFGEYLERMRVKVVSYKDPGILHKFDQNSHKLLGDIARVQTKQEMLTKTEKFKKRSFDSWNKPVVDAASRPSISICEDITSFFGELLLALFGGFPC